MIGWIYVQTLFYCIQWDLVYLDPKDPEYSVNRTIFCWIYVIIFIKFLIITSLKIKYKDCANYVMFDSKIWKTQNYEHIQVPGVSDKQSPIV